MAARDLIGKRGEAIAMARLTDFCGNPEPYFDVHPLGEKCPTFDFLMELLNAGESVPYFFVQVKSTKQAYTTRKRRLVVQVDEEDVRRMVQCPLPTYVIGVHEPTAEAYVVSVHGRVRGPIRSLPCTYPLTPANLRTLWEEATFHWWRLNAGAKVSAFPFEE